MVKKEVGKRIKNGKRAALVTGIAGGIYSIIPLLGMILWGGKGGDPGPLWIFTLPPFRLVFITFLAIAFLFQQIGFSSSGMDLIVGLINVVLWIFIGLGVGWLVKRIRLNGIKNNKALFVGLIVLILGLLLRKAIGGYFFYLTILIFVVLLLYSVIRKLRGRVKNGK